MKRYESYKTEIDPTDSQKKVFEKNFNACRKIFNLYLQRSLKQYDNFDGYDNENQFADWFYNVYMKNWRLSMDFPRGFNNVAVKRTCKNARQVMDKYARGEIGRPRNKNEKHGHITIYFACNRYHGEDIICERHRIFIPGFGWIRIKEKGYLPVRIPDKRIVSGFISKRAGRYFVSVNVEAYYSQHAFANDKHGEAIGIDLGINNFAVLSDGRTFENINKRREIKLLEKRVNRLQRSLSRKAKAERQTDNPEKSRNYDKVKFELEKTYYRLHNIRSDYLNKMVKETVKNKPEYVAIEDLDVSEMVQERMFARSISNQMFYEFRKRLIRKCVKENIEIRVIDKWYPSSKLCHNCGRVKEKLLHSERVYVCECGYKADRDFNASLNIRDAKKYITIKG